MNINITIEGDKDYASTENAGDSRPREIDNRTFTIHIISEGYPSLWSGITELLVRYCFALHRAESTARWPLTPQ
jgi:hypothetical protein